MKRVAILASGVVTLLASAYVCCRALAEEPVYSVSVFVGGTAYREVCSFNTPFPPYHYRLTERTWCEDTNGFVIMGQEQGRGVHRCRALDVECGSRSFTIRLEGRQSEMAKKREAEEEATKRRLKSCLDSGFFRMKTYVLSNRKDSLEDQEVLFTVEEREHFKDGSWVRGMGPESNVLRITTSTNDLVVWDRIVEAFDKPESK